MPADTKHIESHKQNFIEDYFLFLETKDFPCIAAKAAHERHLVKCMVAGNMACPEHDAAILQFLYDFTDAYRNSNEFYHSAAIIFTGPQMNNEKTFDALLWQRLQALEMLDAKNHTYDSRVEADPSSAKFSFSIKEEAFYIIGLHAASSRLARRFMHPTLVFNPHEQFEQLRASSKYDAMKNTVRKRDIALSGSVNPMLQDFGEASEVFQYSGRKYDDSWKCPLKITHATKHNPSA
jgi:FPC/CPF motif-containing protein YcgG